MFGLLTGQEAAAVALGVFRHETGVDPWSLSTEAMQVNAVAQPLICAYQLSVWAALRDRLPTPIALAGYSVGELAAYGCAGALSAASVIRLARIRAALMDEAFPGGGAMVALRGLDRAAVGALCAENGVEIAIVNGTDRMVIGGVREAVAACAATAEERGAKVTSLAVLVPSHTSLMRPAVLPFRQALERADWRTPSAPVLAGISGAAVFAPRQAREVLATQLAQSLDWAACLDGMRERGCKVLLELGPGAALARMAQDRLPDIPARSIADFQRLDGVIAWVRRQIGN